MCNMIKHKWHKEIKAWAEGEEIEYFNPMSGKWEHTNNPIWVSNQKYRVKPIRKKVAHVYQDLIKAWANGETIQTNKKGVWVNVLNPSFCERYTYRIKPKNMKEEVIANKELRVSLDEQLQKLKVLPKSRERALSITKLQEAIMWLGMDLKRLNEENPYPDSYDPSNTKIAPTADGLKM